MTFLALAEIVCSFLIEFLLPLLLELVLELIPYSKTEQTRELEVDLFTIAIIFIIGAGLGYASALLVPPLLPTLPILQLLKIVVGPFLISWLMQKVADLRRSQAKKPFRLEGFWYYYIFALAFLAARSGVQLGLF